VRDYIYRPPDDSGAITTRLIPVDCQEVIPVPHKKDPHGAVPHGFRTMGHWEGEMPRRRAFLYGPQKPQ